MISTIIKAIPLYIFIKEMGQGSIKWYLHSPPSDYFYFWAQTLICFSRDYQTGLNPI